MNLDERIVKVMTSVLGVSKDQINENSSKDTIAGWDSLKHMNLLLALEQEFNVTIPDEDAADLTSYKLIHLVLKDLIN